MVDGFFSKGADDQDADFEDVAQLDPATGEGIDNVDVSDIQRMINRSGESAASPGLDQFGQAMLDGLQLEDQANGDMEPQEGVQGQQLFDDSSYLLDGFEQ